LFEVEIKCYELQCSRKLSYDNYILQEESF